MTTNPNPRLSETNDEAFALECLEADSIDYYTDQPDNDNEE